MFDNLREEASATSFEEEAKFLPAAGTTVNRPLRRPGKFLGMTSFQRFFIAVLLFISICTLGSMCLLITGRIGLF